MQRRSGLPVLPTEEGPLIFTCRRTVQVPAHAVTRNGRGRAGLEAQSVARALTSLPAYRASLRRPGPPSQGPSLVPLPRTPRHHPGCQVSGTHWCSGQTLYRKRGPVSQPGGTHSGPELLSVLWRTQMANVCLSVKAWRLNLEGPSMSAHGRLS